MMRYTIEATSGAAPTKYLTPDGVWSADPGDAALWGDERSKLMAKAPAPSRGYKVARKAFAPTAPTLAPAMPMTSEGGAE